VGTLDTEVLQSDNKLGRCVTVHLKKAKGQKWDYLLKAHFFFLLHFFPYFFLSKRRKSVALLFFILLCRGACVAADSRGGWESGEKKAQPTAADADDTVGLTLEIFFF
jgi:hypothetical protein